LHRNHDPD